MMTAFGKPPFNEIKKHVCSLEWAKRLKELNARQDTTFTWYQGESENEWCVDSYIYVNEEDPHFAAFTVQDFFDIYPELFRFARFKNEWKFSCEGLDAYAEAENNFSNVCARILVTMLKNKNVKLKSLE
jgi:hypothetical protein